MPQMAPMNWLSLFIFFYTLIIFMIIINFFFYLPTTAKLIKQSMKNFPSWKW
uniref:ATP synthase complex subunit 8 n=1 Tax=Brachytemnus porcatus TaxID=1069889 RepID=J9PIZ5_9CUCU|nr:ATP synthase F0 subunit 8 [Brachytemnus porcatus]